MLAGWVMVKFQYPFSLFCHTDSYESHALAYTRQVQYVAVCCYERNLMEGAETLYGCRTVFTVSQQVQKLLFLLCGEFSLYLFLFFLLQGAAVRCEYGIILLKSFYREGVIA